MTIKWIYDLLKVIVSAPFVMAKFIQCSTLMMRGCIQTPVERGLTCRLHGHFAQPHLKRSCIWAAYNPQSLHSNPVIKGLHGCYKQHLCKGVCTRAVWITPRYLCKALVGVALRLCTTPTEMVLACRLYGVACNPKDLYANPFEKGFAWGLHANPCEQGLARRLQFLAKFLL